MSDKPANTVGEWFELWYPSFDVQRWLSRIAREATHCENELLQLYRSLDPVTPLDMQRMCAEVSSEQTTLDEANERAKALHDAKLAKCVTTKQREAREKKAPKRKKARWPSIPKCIPPKPEHLGVERGPHGRTTVAGKLCPHANSRVHDAVSHHVHNKYCRIRFRCLMGLERLPFGKHLRIRFKAAGVIVRRQADSSEFFEVGLNLDDGPVQWVGIKTHGKSDATLAWLSELADTNGHASDGTISMKERGRKKTWQISMSRSRRPGERPAVDDPIEGRTLVVHAPLEQREGECIVCDVMPVHRTPWRFALEYESILHARRSHDRIRRSMSKHYKQTSEGGIRGHGRQRAMRDRLHQRNKADRRLASWIENASRYVVNQAIERRCEGVVFEDLTKRTARHLLLGKFPYHRLIERTKQKAVEAGLTFKRMESHEAIAKLLAPGASNAA